MIRPTFDELPDILTIHEVAEYLRISPAVAYDMARQYRATDGREGLPVVMAGSRLMRVYKVEFARFLAGTDDHGEPAAS